MTHVLKQAFDAAAKLPHREQDAIGQWVLEELASEKRWDKAFARSHHMLSSLAEEALKEHAAGKTRPLHSRRS
jgi:hypothetical protein